MVTPQHPRLWSWAGGCSTRRTAWWGRTDSLGATGFLLRVANLYRNLRRPLGRPFACPRETPPAVSPSERVRPVPRFFKCAHESWSLERPAARGGAWTSAQHWRCRVFPDCTPSSRARRPRAGAHASERACHEFAIRARTKGHVAVSQCTVLTRSRRIVSLVPCRCSPVFITDLSLSVQRTLRGGYLARGMFSLAPRSAFPEALSSEIVLRSPCRMMMMFRIRRCCDGNLSTRW